MFKTLLKLFIVLVILTAACYYSFNLVMSSVIHAKKEIVLPDVKGKSIAEAVEELSKAGLGLRKEGEEFSQSVPPGVVLRQSPPAGMNVREGKVVKVTISQGGEMIYVPDLTGQTVRAADITLKASNLMIGEVSRKYSVIADRGVVISQDPAPSSSVDKDAVINVVISDGKPPEGIILMPDWQGKKITEAKAWAAKEKKTIEVKNEENAEYAPDTVISQVPAPDADITKSDKLVFYVSAPKEDDGQGEIVFNYQLPKTSGNKRLRLELVDSSGKKDVMNSVQKPGASVSVPVKVSGEAVMKVYINKKFVEDINLQ